METITEMTRLSREEILSEISKHESRLTELRQMLPTAIKSFFRFRCKPEKFVWVYADSRELAERKLHERMNAAYGSGWEMSSCVVDQFNDPKSAAANTPGSLCRALTETEAREFIRDFRADQKGRADDPNKPKNLPKSQLEQDVESFELMLRRRDAN